MSYFNEDSLVKLINSINISSNVKDAKTGKYLIANKLASNLFGVDDIVGLTAWDLNDIMSDKWEQKFIPQVVHTDEQVCKTNQPMSSMKIFLTRNGLVRVENTTKVPLSGRLNKVVGVMTVGNSIINTVSLLKIWHLYKNFYPNNTKTAIKQYLIHTKVSNLFEEIPTEAELIIIILNVMHKQPGSKYIGQLLKKAPSTIDNHIAKINEKIIKTKSLLFSVMSVQED